MSDQPTELVHEPTQQGPQRSAAWALAQLSDDAFNQQMEMFQKGRQRLQQVMRSMMQSDVHFGVIPGTGGKPTLLQPGADLLLKMFNLVAEPTHEIIYGDGVTTPQFTIKARCLIHQGDIDGPVVAIGEAAATSWEKKWRYRNAERKCPECGKSTVIKGQAQYGGGWLCWKKKDGCGAKWPDGAQEIEGQQAGQIENPDPFELLNTAVKIANKRAKVHGTIAATDSSDLLTQDMEEGHEPQKTTPEAAQPAKTPQQPPAQANGPQAANGAAKQPTEPLCTGAQFAEIEAAILGNYQDPQPAKAALMTATAGPVIPSRLFPLVLSLCKGAYDFAKNNQSLRPGWLLRLSPEQFERFTREATARQYQREAEVHF